MNKHPNEELRSKWERHWFVIIGTGPTPSGFKYFRRVKSMDKVMGLKGVVHIHLHGACETLVTPEQLRAGLINLQANIEPPTVTLSL